MKRILLSLLVATLSLGFVATQVEAKRLGGGATSGMKRQTPPPQPAQPVPAKPAATPGATAPATPAAPAAAPKRSWMGPIAGLAAGLGIAALMSHLGMGEGMGNILTIMLMAAAAFFLIRFLMRRFGPAAARNQPMQFAGAGTGPLGDNAPAFGSGAAISNATEPSFAAAPAHTLPAGFDAPAFERIAKLIFIRMQAANDAGNLEDLRQFSTPEMFATFRLDLQDRKAAAQQTDVVQLNAQVLDFAQEAERQIVSVRFHGLIREENDGPTTTFDEIWHLVKPADGSHEWAIAGIAQTEAA
ncbi:MAG TPA: Tim44-like domain-containing protein [Rhizobacter sp.]|jgi:predicted lipid-binding transport protein (Tim44 family)|nr:Tim44-like domain-containing protein [Rhizobacter sp.]